MGRAASESVGAAVPERGLFFGDSSGWILAASSPEQ